MPAPGDQHSATANPFEEVRPRVSEYTAQEIATLQSRLEKQLGPEYLSSRAGPGGGRVHYIAAEKCIALANEVFGFNGWSSSIQKIDVDFAEENPQTLKISLGLSVIVRVTLRDGTFHEDIGYGQIENCKSKAQAFEKAKKEGTTDALKRALRNFGNVLGNCIYDKAYVQKVAKMKVEPHKFDEDGLHRHANYAKKEVLPIKQEPTTSDHSTSTLLGSDGFEDLLEGFEEADFCVSEEGHPDEISVVPISAPKPAPKPNPPTSMQPPSRHMGRSSSGGNMPPRPPQTPNQSRPNGPGGAQNQSGPRPLPPPQQQHQQNYSRPPMNQGNNIPAQRPGANGPPQQPPHLNHQQRQQQQQQHQQQQQQNRTPTTNGGGGGGGGGPEPVTAAFFSARAVPKNGEGESRDGPPARPHDMLFNPKAESPSIRKTPGIDHSKSLPLSRSGQHVPGIIKEGGGGGGGTGTGGGGPAASGNHHSAAASPAAAAGPRHPPIPPQQQRGNVVLHPQLDQTRRIGAPPGSAASPLANRGQYKPPTMKRPLPSDGPAAAAAAAGRLPLADLPSNEPVVGGGGGAAGVDVKRVKMS